MNDEIRELVRRWSHEGVAQGHVDVFDGLVTEDAIDHSGPTDRIGVEGFKERASMVHAVFADIEISVDDLLIDGDRVRIAWRWSLRGTHRQAFMGIAASGRRIEMRGMNIQRLVPDAGRVCEHWSIVDRLGVRDQLMA